LPATWTSSTSSRDKFCQLQFFEQVLPATWIGSVSYRNNFCQL
jgi:hypothetical protein